MARKRSYEQLEKNIILNILHAISSFFKIIGRGILYVFRAGDRKMTIMIVPHSQSKVINFQTNVFTLIIGVVLVIGGLFAFVYFNKATISAKMEIARISDENSETLASLDELRDENNNLLQAAKKFQNSLSQSLSLLGIKQSTDLTQTSSQTGDLSSIFDVQEYSKGSVRETADIKQLTSYLESSIQPLEQISKMLDSQGTLFSDVPSVWPLKGGIGHVSFPFGQNVHPITGQWYIHTGMDFSTWRSGDPIIATANGQVVTVAYDSGYGNNIIVKHKHGFYTRYAHLSVVSVQKGDFVSQGDIIGRIGNTGISTGPHLHYEVHIGSDVVDPAKYINVKLK